MVGGSRCVVVVGLGSVERGTDVVEGEGGGAASVWLREREEGLASVWLREREEGLVSAWLREREEGLAPA